MIKSNTIITLENKERYLVLNEATYISEHYFLVMGVNKEKEVISSKVAIFKEHIIENDIYVEQIEDSSLIMTLTKLMKSQVI